MAHAVDANLHALVHEAVFVHAHADAGFVEQVHRDLFDDPGTDAAKDIFAGLPLQDDVVDAVFVKELAQQEARRTRSNDRDLGTHARS